MNNPTDNIKDILEADTSYAFETDLFIGEEPESPNNVVTLFDTPDAGPTSTYNRNERYDYDGVQIRVRNVAYNVAMSKAKELVDTLHGIANRAVAGDSVSVLALDNPRLLDWDENDRARVIVNFQVQQTSGPST